MKYKKSVQRGKDARCALPSLQMHHLLMLMLTLIQKSINISIIIIIIITIIVSVIIIINNFACFVLKKKLQNI